MPLSELELPTGVVGVCSSSAEHQARLLAEKVAENLRFAVQTEGTALLVVAGGRSPVAFFEALSRKSLDWSKVHVCVADERWVPVMHPDSNEGMVRRHLLQNEAAKAVMHSLYKTAATCELAAAEATQAAQQLKWPIDVVVLGMGEDGHVASLFPHADYLEDALDLQQSDATVLATRAPSFPHQRLSFKLGALAAARAQYLSIQGKAKLDTLGRAIRGSEQDFPVKALLQPPLEIYWCP